MNQDVPPNLRQEQRLNIGDVIIEGQGHYLDFSQKQILQISVEEIKTREFIPTSPYKGLKQFEAEDKDLFFGRDQFLRELADLLEQTNLILLLGASGSGKSSVVRAGLIPELSKRYGGRFTHLIFRPDHDPFESLYAKLLDKHKQSEVQIVRAGQVDMLIQVITKLKPSDAFWFLLIDQFEELFTTTQPELRNRFIANLVDLVSYLKKSKNLSVKIIATMRADFLDKLSPYPALVKVADRYRPFMTEMQPDELRLAIEQPAAQHGVVFKTGLVEDIIKDVQGQAGYLPLLQYTLNLLWEKEVETGSIRDRTLNSSTYRTLGGVRGALQKHVEQIYKSLSDEEQLAAQRIFLRLVEIGGEAEAETEWKPVRRRALRSEFSGVLDQQVLLQLIDANLLVSDQKTEAQASTIEIAHEVLLTSWITLNHWIRENRQAIALRNRLNDDVVRWQITKKEDELWSGSKLAQVLELRRDSTFNQVLGGFSLVASQFIDASVGRRDRQRRKTILGLTIFSAVALLLTGVATWQWYNAWKQGKIALFRQLEAQSEQVKNQSPELLNLSVLLAVESARRSSNVGEILSPLLAYQTLDYSLSLLPFPVTRLFHKERLWKVSISPDGQYLATISGQQTEQGERPKYHAQVWEADSKRTIISTNHGNFITDVEFSSDGKFVATSGGDSTVRLWEPDSGREITQLNSPGIVTDIVFSPDGKYLAAINDKEVQIWNLNDGQRVTQVAHSGVVTQVTFSEDGRYLATIGQEVPVVVDGEIRGEDIHGTVRIWQTLTGQEIRRWKVSHRLYGIGLSFSPDGRRLAAQAERNTYVWEVDSGQEIFPIPLATVGGIDFSPNGKYLAVIYEDNDIGIWDVEKHQEFSRISLQKWGAFGLGATDALLFSPDGKYLLGDISGNAIQVWDFPSGREAFRLIHDGEINEVVFSKDSKYIATVSDDQNAIMWDITSHLATRRWKYAMESGDFYGLEFAQNDTYLVTRRFDEQFALDTNDAQGSWRLFENHAENGTESRSVRYKVEPAKNQENGYYNDYRVIETQSGREVLYLTDVSKPTLDSNGIYIAAVQKDGTLVLQNLNSMEEIFRIFDFSGLITFSLDSKYVALTAQNSLAGNSTIEIRDLATKIRILSIKRDYRIEGIAFNSNSRYLGIVGSGNVEIIPFHSSDLVNYACFHITRNFTRQEWEQYLSGQPYRKTCSNLP